MTGFASGLAAGVNAGLGIVSAYRNSERAARQKELEARDDEEYKDRKEAERVMGEAYKGGFDANGYKLTQQELAGPPTTEQQGIQGPPAQVPVTQIDTRDEEQKRLDSLTALERWASGKGKYDLAARAHEQSVALVDKNVEKRSADAWAKFKADGDPEHITAFARRYARDGIDFEPVRVSETLDAQGKPVRTYSTAARDAQGNRTEFADLTEDKFIELAQLYTDPKRMRAAAVQRASELRKLELEATLKRLSHGPTKGKPGEVIVNSDGSQSVIEGTEFITKKDADGNEQIFRVTYGKQGRISEAPVSPAQFQQLASFTKDERKRYENAEQQIKSALQMNSMQGIPSPENIAAYEAAVPMLSDLIHANRGSDVPLDEAKLAQLALKVARKEVQVVPFAKVVNGRQIGVADAIMVDGKPVFINPGQIRAIESRLNQSDAAVANAPGRGQPERPVRAPGNPNAAPGLAMSSTDRQVPPQVQAQRDATAAQVKASENRPGLPVGGERVPAGQVLTPEERAVAERVAPGLAAEDAKFRSQPAPAAVQPGLQSKPASLPPSPAAQQPASLPAAKARLGQAVSEMRKAQGDLLVLKAKTPGGRASPQAKQAHAEQVAGLQAVVNERMAEITRLREAQGNGNTSLAMTQ